MAETVDIRELNVLIYRAAELLCDIVFNSIFPEKELEKEKSVVKDEINSYKDSPGELIYDDFDTLLFGQTGLGRMILGTEKRVESFTRGMVMDFIARNWFTDRMVISTVGNIDFDKFVRLVEKYFLHIPAHFKDKNRRLVYHYRPKHVSKYKKTHQAHVMIGNVCYSYDSIRRASFSLLNNMLGSNAMNSALNMHIREKYGNTYAIESSYTAYCDTGSFCVYAGCEEHFTEKLIELIYKELKRFTDMPPSPLYLKRSKEQLKGQLAIQYDSNQNEMLSMGKLLLNFGDVADLQESFDEIDRLRADQICDTANEIFIPENMSCLIYH